MQLINSTTLGEVDHTLVVAPYVRAVSINKDLNVTLYDVRFKQPNLTFLESDVLHSIEHMLAVELTKILGTKFVNFGLMGCQTGFYLTTSSDVDLSVAFVQALNQSLTLTEVPLCNKFQCGRYTNHNLEGAKSAIRDFLSKKNEWSKVY